MIESPTELEVYFLRKVAEYNREESERRRNELHLTDLISECKRRVWFDKNDPLPDDPENLLRMWQGSMLHQMPLLPEHELELEFLDVKTRIDEYDPELGILIEKKFVTFIPKTPDELRKYYSHYIKQVQYEALFLMANNMKVNKAFLLFVVRGEPEPGRKPIAVFEVPLLDGNLVVTQFVEEVEAYKIILQSPTPPDIPKTYSPFEYPCTYCKYRSRCFGRW